MIRVTASRKEMAADILRHCGECAARTRRGDTWCTRPNCPLRKYTVYADPHSTPMAMDLFRIPDIHVFFSRVVQVASQLDQQFWWSDLRVACKSAAVEPLNKKWWGKVAQSRAWRGCFQLMTDQSRPSPQKLRRGGVEFVWRRRLPNERCHGQGTSLAPVAEQERPAECALV